VNRLGATKVTVTGPCRASLLRSFEGYAGSSEASPIERDLARREQPVGLSLRGRVDRGGSPSVADVVDQSKQRRHRVQDQPDLGGPTQGPVHRAHGPPGLRSLTARGSAERHVGVRPTLDPMPTSDEPRLLAIRVIPRARRDEVGGERNGRLLVRTRAAPVDDQANVAVRKLVAQHLQVAARQVEIVSGHRSRDKVLRIGR